MTPPWSCQLKAIRDVGAYARPPRVHAIVALVLHGARKLKDFSAAQRAAFNAQITSAMVDKLECVRKNVS